MSFFIDTHAHIYLDEFEGDRESMLNRASDEQVERIFMPNVDETSIESMLRLEESNPAQCIAMMGLHPCYVKGDYQRQLYEVEAWLSKRKFAAVGEIGTDLYWDKTFWEQQKDAFLIQVGLAKKHTLPVVIHCRESIDETIALVTSERSEALTGIFHCFGGSLQQAQSIIDLGFKLGIGGVATFKKGGLDLVLPHLTLNDIVLETDSPYLAPAPFRGKRNEPAYIRLVANRVAELMNCTVEEVQAATTKNALALFGG